MLKIILTVWGYICLFFAVMYLILSLYAASSPSATFTPGATGLGEWIGMGLLSLGVARVLHLSEKK